ncbi:LysR substrate-binding domain-containing protein [Vineibacter terrae]|uniref:LysR substrate-binding domain-containing protein n=1 Tax=Vineibacter terrae TaxID=2586908 RepID=UPI002E2F46F0|nr:LysR substrate-binding domain-containing protein [Vineibacter terrae]HEX2885712.1 LysR substrate-binding domain-containing protein [Vineibacter terrae]
MYNLRALDLNLLTVMEAIYEMRSITAAAERLGITQSAASHALGRLRDALRDDLFVRSSDGLVPTASAQALYPAVRDALDTIREAVSGKATFAPARSRRSFRIAIPHVMGPFIGLQLEEHVAAAAPSVELNFDTRTLPFDLLSDMEEGRTDVAVDWMPASQGMFINQHLFDDELILIARRDHPRIDAAPTSSALDRERFVALHLRPSMGSAPDALRKLLVANSFKTAFRVSEFLEIPAVVASTDLLGIMPMSIARQLRSIALLRLLPLPLKQAPVPIVLTWHAGRRRDPGHAWLRRVVRQEVRRFAAEALAVVPTAA